MQLSVSNQFHFMLRLSSTVCFDWFRLYVSNQLKIMFRLLRLFFRIGSTFGCISVRLSVSNQFHFMSRLSSTKCFDSVELCFDSVLFFCFDSVQLFLLIPVRLSVSNQFHFMSPISSTRCFDSVWFNVSTQFNFFCLDSVRIHLFNQSAVRLSVSNQF